MKYQLEHKYLNINNQYNNGIDINVYETVQLFKWSKNINKKYINSDFILLKHNKNYKKLTKNQLLSIKCL